MRGNFSKRICLCVILILYFALPTPAFPEKAGEQALASLGRLSNKFSFALLGDSQGGDEVYLGLLKLAISHKPDFIIHLGDRVSAPGKLAEWSRLRKFSDAAGIPSFFVVGNHDLDGTQSEQMYIRQSKMPGNGLYYSFILDKSLLVVLDTFLAGEEYRITGRQYEWLKKVLDNSQKYRFKFVFLHHPLFPEIGRGIHYGDCLDKYPKERDRLQALFVKHKVDVVFAAHEHLYLRKKVDGIYHVISGGGGAQLYASQKDGGFFHYIAASVEGDRAGVTIIDSNGVVRDSFSVTRK